MSPCGRNGGTGTNHSRNGGSSMNEYKPPFHITDKMTSLTAEISEQVGRITVLQGGTISPRLRRGNRIRTIHSSLAIEHNSLSLEQVTAILDGKRVLGNPNEIREVQNAYEAYELMLQLDPASINDLLKAHKLLMNGLVPENGRFRSGAYPQSFRLVSSIGTSSPD